MLCTLFLNYLFSSFLDVYFFFFQAEDGIRDHCVTGVQTCALPIWFDELINRSLLPVTRADAANLVRAWQQLAGIAIRQAPRIAFKVKGRILFLELRSEERRVGKECRYRWSAYH